MSFKLKQYWKKKLTGFFYYTFKLCIDHLLVPSRVMFWGRGEGDTCQFSRTTGTSRTHWKESKKINKEPYFHRHATDTHTWKWALNKLEKSDKAEVFRCRPRLARPLDYIFLYFQITNQLSKNLLHIYDVTTYNRN